MNPDKKTENPVKAIENSGEAISNEVSNAAAGLLFEIKETYVRNQAHSALIYMEDKSECNNLRYQLQRDAALAITLLLSKIQHSCQRKSFKADKAQNAPLDWSLSRLIRHQCDTISDIALTTMIRHINDQKLIMEKSAIDFLENKAPEAQRRYDLSKYIKHELMQAQQALVTLLTGVTPKTLPDHPLLTQGA
jgi:hypothetical protein